MFLLVLPSIVLLIALGGSIKNGRKGHCCAVVLTSRRG